MHVSNTASSSLLLQFPDLESEKTKHSFFINGNYILQIWVKIYCKKKSNFTRCKMDKEMEAIFKVTEEAVLYWHYGAHCWKMQVTKNLILAVSFGSSKISAGKFSIILHLGFRSWQITWFFLYEGLNLQLIYFALSFRSYSFSSCGNMVKLWNKTKCLEVFYCFESWANILLQRKFP